MEVAATYDEKGFYPLRKNLIRRLYKPYSSVLKALFVMDKRLFRKLSLRLSACLALRSGRTICPHGLIEQRKGAALVERIPVLFKD